MPAKKDMYAQIAYIVNVESAANTLSFQALSVFSNILTPKGLLIERVEHYISPVDYNKILDESDSIVFGLCGDSSMSTVSLADAQVYDYNRIGEADHGTPANAELLFIPVVNDYTTLSGGGRLVPADRIYSFIQGVSLASAVTVETRFHFRMLDLSAQEYLELAQALRVLT